MKSIKEFKNMNVKTSLNHVVGGERKKTSCDITYNNCADVAVYDGGKLVKIITNKFDGNPFNNDVG